MDRFRSNSGTMDERMDESPEDAPDPVQAERIDDNDDILDEDDDFQMERSRDDEDPFVPAKRGFRQKYLRMNDDFGEGKKKEGDRKDRKTPEPRNSAKSPVMAVKVLNPDAVRLDKLVGVYEANAFIARLEFIIESCPPLEKECFIRLVSFLKETKRSAQKYSLAYARAEGKAWFKEADVPFLDKEWYEGTQAAATGKTDALLHELKKQKDEGVKESTRRAMEDLLAHYGQTGQLAESFKQYNRGMREYCLQMKHIISMYLAWLEVAVLLGEWHRVAPLISQTERALQEADDAENQANAPGGRVSRNQYDQVEASRKTNRAFIAASRSKVNAIHGLSALEAKDYKRACEKFLLVDADHLGEPWILAPFDVARYGSLCALATLERGEMKAKCLDSKFRKMLESEAMLVDAVTAYTRSQFTRFFHLINGIRDTMLVDPFMSAHVPAVYKMVKKRALAQYLSPFAVADLATMASVFGMTPAELSCEVIALMDGGVVRGRFNDREGIIEMRTPDERAHSHAKLGETCDKLCARAEWTVIRALVQSSKIFVTADESKQPARGKRRTNDENNQQESGSSSGGGHGGIMRNMKSFGLKMMNRGGRGENTGGGERAERENRAGVANEADSSAETDPSHSSSSRHGSVSHPIAIPSSQSSAMEAEPSEPHM